MVWWSDPGKEVLNILFNRVLAPYVENLDMNQVNYGIGQGRITLSNLRLKKGALDKFRLPVDVIEGHLGKFSLSLHWMNLGNQPVEVMVEDVYLLVVPSSESKYDPEEDEKRKQAAKEERLQNAELLHVRGTSDMSQDSQESQGLVASLITKIVNNLQITVRNIHVRYEDKMSVPNRPLAVGVTLGGFTAQSTNERWEPAFIDSKAGAVHKLGKLQSLAVYFDTDSSSMAGLSHAEFVERFKELISEGADAIGHQFILKPVNGEGRIIMNPKLDESTPRFDVQLLFDQIGILLDDNQYRDAISLFDMYHFYMRQHQYMRFRPSAEELEENRPRAMLRFALNAISAEVRERKRKWTWAYFAERRDDRHRYVDLFKKKELSALTEPADIALLDSLDKKLTYEDIRFYRSIARSQLKKDMAARKRLEEERKNQQPQAKSSWSSWIWGSSPSDSSSQEQAFTGEMTDDQRKELYEALDYDEKEALAGSFETPRDALKARVAAQLKRGSLALKTDPHGKNKEILAFVFDAFRANLIQRPDNFEAEITLGGFEVHDGTTSNTLYPQIVHVQENKSGGGMIKILPIDAEPTPEVADPFFYVKFENNPLDDRADTALTVRLRYMEIVYHRGYVEAIYKFFKPPQSQLESLEALLDAASQTLEGLRKETRAGLEYALQTHKTIDVQMDLNAPIIIIPEDITTNNCRHLLIDAGHISVESELADKKAVQEIRAKRNQQYTDEDYQRLESMMYDKLSVRLQDAQFLIGNDLGSCRRALGSESHDKLHLLERISIDLQVQNSIVPTVYNLARFKISGRLPTLHANFSDTKYKALMRLIDVCIPKFGDVNAQQASTRPNIAATSTGKSRSGFFGHVEEGYTVDEADDDKALSPTPTPHDQHDEFFEASTGDSENPAMRQHTVEVNFQVDTLRASVYKSTDGGSDRLLGELILERFALAFAMSQYIMNVNISLSALAMDVVQSGKDPLKFISSAETTADDLLTVKYTRAQEASPDFQSVYEGIDQSVDIKVTTFVFCAAPEPVLGMYEFIMTTFVPEKSSDATPSPQLNDSNTTSEDQSSDAAAQQGKIRVITKLASVQVLLMNDDVKIATISLSTADVLLLLRGESLRMTGRLGSLDIVDDSELSLASPGFKQILSIEGDNFADFSYQTFDSKDMENNGRIRSAVQLSTGSLKLHYLEHTLRDIYLFLVKLAKLKGLYDAATEAAVQRASEIERMRFDVSIKTPILVFPSDVQQSSDVLVMQLGEFSAKNAYDNTINRITAGLTGIQLTSEFHYEDGPSVLNMIDEIDVKAEVVQRMGIDRSADMKTPDMQVSVEISDIISHLTEVQYKLLIAISQSVPRVLAAPEGTSTPPISDQPATSFTSHAALEGVADLQPELRTSSSVEHPQSWTSMDVVVSVKAVKLHLYDGDAKYSNTLKEHGIARFALNETNLRMKMLQDGAMEAQIVLKSLTMSNTRPGQSKFRDIMPATQHGRSQVMILYTKSGGTSGSALAVVTVDSPQVIFAIDPVIALLGFFTSAFPQSGEASSSAKDNSGEQRNDTQETASSFDFRLDIHDASISVLEDDTNPETQAISLAVKQVLLSQQSIFALSVERLGMSLTHMGHSADSVRFMDDIDLTLTLDSRATSSDRTTSLALSVKPIVFRASYRDILLITTIVNKAVEAYAQSTRSSEQSSDRTAQNLDVVPKRPDWTTRKSSRVTGSQVRPVGDARILVSKEEFNGSFDGLRLVLIGDLHEQPMLHVKFKPFTMSAKDWSSELQATSTLAVHVSYWNLANSHWEPLIDPWTFSTSIAQDSAHSEMKLSLSARERLDVNITTTFVELTLATAKMMGKEGEKVLRNARGAYAPYRVRNRTGSTVYIWSDVEAAQAASEKASKQIPNDKTVDWRFDDWKTIREHVSSSGHNSLGLQIVGKPWEQLRSIPVDREGEYTFSLRPRTDKYSHRLLCEVKVEDNVKLVTLRSTYLVVNDTLYPLEITLVDDAGHPLYSVEKIAPGQDYALPIEAVNQHRIRIQPDQGFGYKWSSALRWEEFISKRRFTIRCPHNDPSEAAFRFQASVETDANDINARKIPRITLRLRAPVELENLLPYNLEYRIYDKDTDQNWRSYLRKGGVMPVHSVELGHLILLNVSVQDTAFKPSEFAIISTDGNSDFDVENSLILKDSGDRKLDLRLNYVRHPDGGGSFKVQIYCPYLILNKTGLPFGVRPLRSGGLGKAQEIAGETNSEILSSPVPFMLSIPNDNSKEFSFRVGDSAWSQPVSLDAPAADTRLVIPSRAQKLEEVHVGLSWSEGLGKYKLTKVITLAPRFFVKNSSYLRLSFREHGAAPRGRSTLDPGERCPLHVIRASDQKLLTFAVPGLNAQWSAPINIEDIGSVHFRLQEGDEHSKLRLMRLDVKIDGSTIFIYVAEATDGWPFEIENDSEYSFTLCQTDQTRANGESANRPVARYTVPAKGVIDYAWDYPAAREKKLLLTAGDSRRAIDIMEIGDLVPFKFASPQGTRVVSLDVRADGQKQVLRVSNYDPQHSLYRLRRSNSLSLSRSDTMSSSQDAFEAVQEEVPPFLTLSIDFAGLGISLINRRMTEVVYASLNALTIMYTNSAVSQSVNVSCGNLQLDNQLHDALFPVVVQPSPISKEAGGVASLPTVQGSIIWLKDQDHGVFFVKYCSVLLQALTIEADEDFLFSLYDLTKIKGASWDEGQQDILIQHPEEVPEPRETAKGEDVYFEVLELQPIRLSLSFMRTERVSSEEKLSIQNPIAVLVNALTMALGNVNDASLEMNALAIKDMRLTAPELQERILHHYTQEVLRQLYRILGSADFIGNPVGLFTNVSSGVADIFYEPFNGVIMHGNSELGIGIAKGAASFVKKTVFGFSDSFTKFTSSVGKGLSATTFDSEYQLRRRMNQRRNRPRHAIYGVAAGAEAFASSVVSGVEGVVMKPIEGAERGGAKGFFKGVGKGLIGAVTKPVVGVFDLASNVGEGIRNTTTVFDNPARDRVRLPRLIPADGVLVPYSDREALGQYWMKDLENGRFREELYVAHINLPGGDNVVLLTAERVVSFWSNRLRLEWELPFSYVQGVTIEDTGLRFAHKSGKDQDRFVLIPDKNSRSWFFGQVASVVKAFNARRRMDS